METKTNIMDKHDYEMYKDSIDEGYILSFKEWKKLDKEKHGE